MFIKVINRRVILPPVNDGNHCNVNIDPNWLKEHGFFEVNEDELERYVIDLVSPIRVYSKAKIVTLLGNKIKDYIPLLEKEGLLVDFITTDTIAVHGLKFSHLLVKINEDHPGLLEKCVLEG